jgi:hypothetical protein
MTVDACVPLAETGIGGAADRVRLAERRGGKEKFTSPPHPIHSDMLPAAFFAMRRGADDLAADLAVPSRA